MFRDDDTLHGLEDVARSQSPMSRARREFRLRQIGAEGAVQDLSAHIFELGSIVREMNKILEDMKESREVLYYYMKRKLYA